jgi:hypothetical protein
MVYVICSFDVVVILQKKPLSLSELLQHPKIEELNIVHHPGPLQEHCCLLTCTLASIAGELKEASEIGPSSSFITYSSTISAHGVTRP